MISELSPDLCYHSEYTEKTKYYNIAIHLYETFPNPDMETCSFYEWAELILSHCNRPTIALDLAHKLHVLYQNELGNKHFKTSRMICRIGCNEKNCNHIESAFESLNRGRIMLMNIPNKNVYEAMYLSDVDLVLSGIILHIYEKSRNDELLNQAKDICLEQIRIRKELKPYPYCNPDWKNCVVGNYQLSKINLYRNDLIAAERCLRLVEDELQSCNLGYEWYYLHLGKAELAAAKAIKEDEIDNMEKALECRKYYFGNCISGDTSADIVDLQVHLGKLYEEVGDSTKAINIYRSILNTISSLPYYNEEHERIASYIDNIELQNIATKKTECKQ